MSRRRRNRMPHPPMKRVNLGNGRFKYVPTEVHEAFMSMGDSRKLNGLSDGEFNRQVKEEVQYMFDKGAYHARNAAGALSDLWDLLF